MARIKTNPILLVSMLDPTTQTGLVRDAMVIQAHEKPCLTICHAIVNQNDIELDDVTLFSFEEIKRQLDAIGRKYWIDWVMINGIQDLTLAAKVIRYIKLSRPGIHILWAPQLRHEERIYRKKLSRQEEELFIELCQKCHTLLLDARDFLILSEPIRPDILHTQGNLYLLGKEHQQDVFYTPFHSPVYPPLSEEEAICFLPALTAALYEGLSVIEACNQARQFVSNHIIN